MNKAYSGTFLTEVEVMDRLNQPTLDLLTQFGFKVTIGKREDLEGIATQEYVCQEDAQKFTPWPEYLKVIQKNIESQGHYFSSTWEGMGYVQ